MTLIIGLWVGSHGIAQDVPVAPSAAARVESTGVKRVETGEQHAALSSFDELMRSFVADNKLPGATLSVTRGGQLVYARGFGWADVENKQKMQPESLMRIASISKPITAVAILQLVDRQLLKLDDRIVDVLQLGDQLTDARWRRITVRHCLQHSGGWDRSKSFDPMFQSVRFAREQKREPPAGTQQVIQSMIVRPLDFDPGTQYAYSNFGYCLLGRVIERKTGRAYEEFVKASVLAPLGIRRMRLGKTLKAERATDEVRYYTKDGRRLPSVVGPQRGQAVPAAYGGWYLEAMDAHGGWIASAVDLVRLASAFDDPTTCEILSTQSIQTMFSRPAAPLWLDENQMPRAHYYGCGWLVRPVGSTGRLNTWHTGSLDGTSTLLVRRHDGLNWCVLFNSRDMPDGSRPAVKMDPLIHRAADAVKAWPGRDLFSGQR
jgi:N-acyl-D-amino-acid deacylase